MEIKWDSDGDDEGDGDGEEGEEEEDGEEWDFLVIKIWKIIIHEIKIISI